MRAGRGVVRVRGGIRGSEWSRLSVDGLVVGVVGWLGDVSMATAIVFSCLLPASIPQPDGFHL